MAVIEARVKQKIDTEANWLANPLVLLQGEQAFVSNTRNFKIGDGTKKFSELPYFFNLPTDVYSKTEINNLYQLVSKSRDIPRDYYNTTYFQDMFTSDRIVKSNQLSVGFSQMNENGLQLANNGVNLFVKADFQFFNISTDPFNSGRVVFTSGGSDYTKGNTAQGWTRDLAFTVNNVPISAPAFNQNSLKGLKENIIPYEKSALELVNKLEIVRYDYKDENAPKNMIGVIVDDDSTADDFKSELKNGIDLYKMISLVAKSVQELSKKING